MRITLLIVFGAAGTLARYGLQGFVQHRAGSSFPTGTLIVNILGCLLLGGVTQFGLHHLSLSPDWRDWPERWISWRVHYIFHFRTGDGAAAGRWRMDAERCSMLSCSVIGGLLAIVGGMRIADLI